jgi:hypothetical protein
MADGRKNNNAAHLRKEADEKTTAITIYVKNKHIKQLGGKAAVRKEMRTQVDGLIFKAAMGS